MLNKKQNFILLITLIFVLIIINYPSLNKNFEDFLTENQQIVVDRVIDGDTIESNETSIRLLGINSPERGEYYYEEAKMFLESLILNKTLTLEFTNQKQDKYYRTLAYLFYNRENINVKMVENGFANYYFYSGKDEYSDSLIEAWNTCLEKEVNLCEPSTNMCASCISINETHITNFCNFSCNIEGWFVKEEGRDKIVFNSDLNVGESLRFDLDLSDSSGSLFLRDNEGKLVLWKSKA